MKKTSRMNQNDSETSEPGLEIFMKNECTMQRSFLLLISVFHPCESVAVLMLLLKITHSIRHITNNVNELNVINR